MVRPMRTGSGLENAAESPGRLLPGSGLAPSDGTRGATRPGVGDRLSHSEYADEIATSGFAVRPEALASDVVAALLDAVVALDGPTHRRPGGVRNVLAVSAVAAVVASPAVRAWVEPILGPAAVPVRGILFDKTPGANWLVPWRQDVTVAVRARAEVPGWGPWSVKAGVPHVRPPAAVLASMLTVRVHLDDCDEANGPLRVLPGSHRAGVLDAAAVERWRADTAAVACTTTAGGAVVIRPLLLHASSAATRPRHRRVLHVEFAAGPLDNGLEWAV